MKFARTVVALVVLLGVVACGDHALRFDYAEVSGPGTLGVKVAGKSARGVIVYFHGADQNAEFIRDSEKHVAFFEPLLRAGYAVVAADAGGNAYGNPDSRQAYRKLISAAQVTYGVHAVLYVAESMGALAALALLGEQDSGSVRGMVGITPLMGLPSNIRTVTFIADQWGGVIPDSADPLSWSPTTFKGRNILLYEADSDRVIPQNATATAFRMRFDAVANVKVVTCRGNHVDPSCYQGKEVELWLGSLG